MKLLDVTQGSPEWLAARRGHHTASEAPIMMGASTKAMRNELLDLKKIAAEKEYSAFVERLFEKGHAAEEAARPIIEGIIGEDLFPTTGTDDAGWLLASFDGVTMLEDTIFEHKLWNETLAQAVRDKDLPAEYYWQLEQQLLVSGAERAIFVVSDGTEDTLEWMEYRPVEGRAEALIAGWRQFEKDLATHEPAEPKAEVVGRTPENLPALLIEVKGEVTASNLREYQEHAIAVFRGINRDLTTDQEFADAERTVKWCKDVEDRLKAAKEHALSQTATIDDLFRAIDAISAEARATRLELDRLVKAEKEKVRRQIQTDAQADFDSFLRDLGGQVKPLVLPAIPIDIAGAMKGKRTIATLQNAADSEVARAKIEAQQIAEDLVSKRDWFDDNVPAEHEGLFRDLADLATMPEKHFQATVIARLEQHQRAEEERIKAEAERLAQEKLAAEQQAQQQAEPTPVPTAPMPEAEAATVTAGPATKTLTLTLDDINARLYPIQLTKEGLDILKIHPVDSAGRSYSERAFHDLCHRLLWLVSAADTAAKKETT